MTIGPVHFWKSLFLLEVKKHDIKAFFWASAINWCSFSQTGDLQINDIHLLIRSKNSQLKADIFKHITFYSIKKKKMQYIMPRPHLQELDSITFPDGSEFRILSVFEGNIFACQMNSTGIRITYFS